MRYAAWAKLERSKPEYKLWRAEVYRRDKWRCRICERKEKIEAHHILPLRTHREKRLEVQNGITLCFKCHRLIFGKEILVAQWLSNLVENGVNSVELPDGDNTEPSLGGNPSEGVTTRCRGYRIEQFVTREIPCAFCGEKVLRHYYRIGRSKKFICKKKSCRQQLAKEIANKVNAPRKKSPVKNLCIQCKKETNTPSDHRRVKKYCSNHCQLKYEWEHGRVIKGCLNGRWTKKYNLCLNCHSNQRKHYGKGYCMKCYNQRYNASKTPTNALPARDDIV